MRLFILICFCCAFQQQVLSQSNLLVRSTTGASGSSEGITIKGSSYLIQQSIGQSGVIGAVETDNYILRQGFIQPDVFAKIKDPNIPMDLQISLYPNPFEEQISLVFNEDVKGDVRIVVFNIIGSRVYLKSYKPNQRIDIRLDWLPSGEYILKTVANHKQFISKIIKK